MPSGSIVERPTAETGRPQTAALHAWRSDVVVLSGPPCSGKSTFAACHALPDDRILDWDALFAELTGLPPYVQPDHLRHQVARAFVNRAQQLRRGWFISCAPTRQQRAMLRRQSGGSSIILALPADECVARLDRSDRPAAVKTQQRRAIAQWWSAFEPSTSTPECILRSASEIGAVRVVGRMGLGGVRAAGPNCERG